MSLPGVAWIASDLRHVISRHDCTIGVVETVLPSMWKADDRGVVHPSVNCVRCGYHAFPILRRPPDDATVDLEGEAADD